MIKLFVILLELVFSFKCFVAPIVFLTILILIGISWLFYSYVWNKQEDVSEFLLKNKAFLIEKNISMNPEKTIFSTYISSWNECDLFLLPEGLVLRGGDSKDFNDCAFLYFTNSTHPLLKGFRYYGKYKKPKVSDNSLHYYLLLYNNDLFSDRAGDIYPNFFLSPNEKTIEILRQKNLL